MKIIGLVRAKKLRNNSFFLYIRMSLVALLTGPNTPVYYSLFFLYMLGWVLYLGPKTPVLYWVKKRDVSLITFSMTRLIWFDRGSWYWSKLLAYLSDYDSLFWLTANASEVLLWILCEGTRFPPDKKWILGVWAFGVGIYNPSPQLRNGLCKQFDIYIVSLLNCYRFKSNMVNIEGGRVLLG